MKFVSRALYYICFLAYFPLKAQNVTLTGTIYDYATYYVSSFDPQTGASDFQLFRYTPVSYTHLTLPTNREV